MNNPLASRDLLPGDVIHVPFSAAEKEYMEKKFKSSNEDPFETARSSAQILHGRTVKDCWRWIEGVLRSNIPNRTFTQSTIVIFPKRKLLSEPKRDQLSLLHHREVTSRRKPKQSTSQWENLFQRFKPISASTNFTGQIVECAFNPIPEKAQLAVCSAASEEDGTESTSMIFDLKTGKSTKLVGHKPTVSNIRFSLQGDFVITSGYDKVLRVWTADDGNLCHTLEFREEEERAHDGKVECMSLHRTNDSLIASSGEDRSICLWNIYTGECTDSISTKESAANWTGNPVALTFMQEEYSNYLLAGLDCRGDQGAVVKI